MSQTSPSIRLPAADTVRSTVQTRNSRRAQRRLVGRLVLGLTDILVVQLAIVLAGAGLSLLARDSELTVLWSPALGTAAALVVVASSLVLGLYDPAGLGLPERFRGRFCVAAILPWLTLAAAVLSEPVAVETVMALCGASLIFLSLGTAADALVRRTLISHAGLTTDVVLIGSRDAAKRVVDGLLAKPSVGLRPIGYCGPGADTQISAKVPFLGTIADLAHVADAADVAIIAYDSSMEPLDVTRLPFNRVVLVPDVPNIARGCMRSRTIGGAPAFDLGNPARAGSHRCAKRVLDLVVALPLFLLTLPVMLTAAIAIRMVSPGPVFYVQRRVGWNGRTVSILKLRSMYVDAEVRLAELLRNDADARREWETYVKLSHDPRILPVIGNILRRSSIDELPQLWNVVRGDISLVGPRPFPAYHVERFSPEFQRLRCSVPPGLTGLWQVSVRNSSNLQQQEEIDTKYIRNWSLWLDLWIILRTVPAVLSLRGAR